MERYKRLLGIVLSFILGIGSFFVVERCVYEYHYYNATYNFGQNYYGCPSSKRVKKLVTTKVLK